MSLYPLLLQYAEPRLRDFAAALIPNLSRPMLGVRLPRLREIARAEARLGCGAAFEPVRPEDCYEEVLVKGMVVGYAQMPLAQRIEGIRRFVPHIDNWSVCDSCAATYTAVRAQREEVWPMLSAYAESRMQYEQRFAAVMLLDHYLTDEYIDRVLALLAAINPAGSEAVKGIGWALATASAKYPACTLPMLADERIPMLCRKMARRKILESRRTAPELRAEVKRMTL